MKKILIFLMIFVVSLGAFTACGNTPESPTNNPSIQSPSDKENEMNKLKITTSNGELIATLAINSSTKALKEIIEQNGGSLTINMSDYGGFEKVGSLGTSLPTDDTQITTTACDIMLYQGNSIVIFYGSNSWSYTRLGKIENATKEDLLAVLGSGNVSVTLSIIK